MRVAAATDALSRAETKAAEAENAVSEYIKSQASAFKEDARMATKVDAATAEVDQARHRLQELNEQPTAQNAWDGSANAKALGALTDRDLNEVRKFSKPPHVVRRALELVQAMLAVADGTESLPPSGTGDVQWAELQRMLARDDFIRQMLTLKPAALSARPHLLTEIGERWPSLQEAAAVAAANDARLDAKVAASMAATALDGLRKSLEEAERLLSSAIEAVERRRERDAKWREGQAERDEAARRAAQAEIERDLASRTARPPAAWLHEHHIKEDLSAVAIEFATVSASLPADASNSLAKIASELRSSVTLRLHIAGHVQPDEDARLASQRAMNVGGLLIALGVLPLQLRAKGYGARAPIGPGEKRRLGLKSLRRVTLHALAEVRTRTPCEFGPGELAPLESEAVREMVRAVAALMQLDEHKEVRLSVEGHSDDHGSAAENVRISLARANAVCRQLEGLGVDQARLVPHGFGAAFPIDDNGTEDGRQHNRRVEFLVIPTCFAAAVRSDATAASTGGRGMGEGLSSHLSNRPGVAKVLRLF
ncbi:outer membrane protein [Chrysochromulina tobinii]|uniref:Outer membrane protein n=1 Tax=Chrysochromulina tobinii TaxID=1460289 RepID=A0A0M0K6W5_9EUKA|nr:outer membrane protein [Chrysochromulina tobinii]|eukprot:KOO34616.1 outer membrane protein [Chrysochromulina sp. CCMP291]